jgi:hypothetical protein
LGDIHQKIGRFAVFLLLIAVAVFMTAWIEICQLGFE